ncbi:MAG: Amidohydrolase [Planctomycetes bacterium ADurb.Bin401]|nr:MAG: Amidohydrolase [Planctomycetes bacterium ADurb.Bin401]
MNKQSFRFNNILKTNCIIDAHVHLPSVHWPHHKSFFDSVDSAVDYLKKAGIDGAVFNTWQGVFSKSARDVDEANADALNLAKIYNGFLYPGAVINPLFNNESKLWLEKFRDAGSIWAGELVLQNHGLPYIAPEFLKLFEICAKHNHIVQLHQDKDIIKLAAHFPQLRIVCSHIPESSTLLQLAKCKNVWLDISGSIGGLVIGQIEKSVKAFGIDRVLFGSDFDGYEPASFIARVNSVIKNAQDREKIFKNNFLSLLK